jgi:hypothetical protein
MFQGRGEIKIQKAPLLICYRFLEMFHRPTGFNSLHDLSGQLESSQHDSIIFLGIKKNGLPKSSLWNYTRDSGWRRSFINLIVMFFFKIKE